MVGKLHVKQMRGKTRVRFIVEQLMNDMVWFEYKPMASGLVEITVSADQEFYITHLLLNFVMNGGKTDD